MNSLIGRFDIPLESGWLRVVSTLLFATFGTFHPAAVQADDLPGLIVDHKVDVQFSWPWMVETDTWTLTVTNPASRWLLAPDGSLLPAGAEIGTTAAEGSSWSDHDLPLMMLTSFAGVIQGGGLVSGDDIGFIGARFMAADGEHFGWLRYAVSVPFSSVYLRDAAFQSIPRNSIAAGEVPLSLLSKPEGIALSWSASVTNLTLEAIVGFDQPVWKVVEGVVSNTITLSASDSRRFFRLRP